MGNLSLPQTHQTDYTITMRPDVPRSRKKNGRTQCMSPSLKNNIILALEKLQRRKNACENDAPPFFACFSNNGIYYEGQSMAL